MPSSLPRNWRDAPRGDYETMCSICGVAWPRSKLRRKADGLLYCPDDRDGRDPATLARLNAARIPRLRHIPQDGGGFDSRSYEAIGHDYLPLEPPELDPATWEPADVAGYILNLNPYSNIQLTKNTNNADVVTSFGSRVGARIDDFTNSSTSAMPLWKPSGWTRPDRTPLPALESDGGNDYLRCVSSLALDMGGGLNNDFHLFFVVEFLSLTGTGVLFGFGTLTPATQALWDIFQVSGVWRTNKRGDTGGLTQVTGDTTATGKHIVEVIQAGTTVTVKVDGVVVLSGAQATVTAALENAALFAVYAPATGPVSFGAIRFARGLGFDRVLTSENSSSILDTLTGLYL